MLQTYSGSRRTFAALLKTMIKRNKFGLVLALIRRNSSPVFCALLPQASVYPSRYLMTFNFSRPFSVLQAEKTEEEGWSEPGGFHLIPLPFADDIRAAPIDKGHKGCYRCLSVS